MVRPAVSGPCNNRPMSGRDRRRGAVWLAVAMVAALVAVPVGAQPLDEQRTFAPLRLAVGQSTSAPQIDRAEATNGRFVVQFDRPVDRADAAALSEQGAVVAGYLPDNAFAVRVPAGAAIPDLEGIRIVAHEPAWRVSPALNEAGPHLIRVQIDADVDPSSVAAHLTSSGAEVLRVGEGSIVAIVEGSLPAALAAHAAIAWVGPLRIPRTHNESAGGIIGTTAAISAGYDGAGQIVAVADTGLGDGTTGGAHTDIPASRIVAIEDWLGANLAGCWTISGDGAQDVDSGHGTHTTGSVLSDGAADGTGRGSAPAASLVFQATEDYVDFTTTCEFIFGYEDGYYLLGLPEDLNDLFQQAYDHGARIHSDSWGSDAAGEYDESAQDVDEFTWNHPDFLVVTSAGNAGVDGNADGVIDNDSTGSPATAKNVLTVGASEGVRTDGYPCEGSYANTLGVSCADQSNLNTIFLYGDAWPTDYPVGPIATDASAGNAEQMAAFSSRGPTDDGRIKPDVVAPGTWILSNYSPLYQEGYGDPVNPANGLYQSDGWGFPASDQYKYMGGTSMSAPLVAGGAALVRDYYDAEHAHDASAALVKATLINSAVDLLDEDNDGANDNAFPIPNNHEGWGRVDIGAATDGSAAFVDGESLSTGQSDTYELTVTGADPLKVTVVWSDAPGTVGAGVTLVNNLDVVVTSPGAATYRGNNFSGGWTVTGGSADSLNNVENVYIAAPAAGTWTVEISGSNVPQGPQPYALVVDGATIGSGGADTQAPAWPDGATLTEGTITDSTIGVSWPAATDNVAVVGYDLYVDGAFDSTVTGTSATIDGLASSITYSISVTARDAAGNTAAGPSDTFTTTATPDTQAPTWPGGAVLTEGTITADAITVSWPAATDNVGVVAYDVFVDGAFEAPVTTTSVTVNGLDPDTGYEISVTARDAAGNTAAGPSGTFTTLDDAPPPDTTKPVLTGALTVDASGPSWVTLSWPAATDNVGVVAYDVSVDGAPVLTVTSTAVTITGLAAETTYAISVTARDAAGNVSSPLSTSVTTPAVGGSPPPDATAPSWEATRLTVREVLETSADVSWPMALDANGIASYEVTVSGGPGIAKTTVGGSTLSIGLGALTPDTLYSVAVIARDPAGNESVALSASFTTAVDFADTDGHIFEADIAWLAAKGITAGCGDGTTFCPAASLTRAQMASLLVRAFDLPATGSSPFTDVSGVHAANINALAAAGITSGCNASGTRFCPNDVVTRAQMATFLSRAFELDPATTDWFGDDGGSPHEAAINALAESGITLGCATGRFCPGLAVSRGQIAAFLHRGFVIFDLD